MTFVRAVSPREDPIVFPSRLRAPPSRPAEQSEPYISL